MGGAAEPGWYDAATDSIWMPTDDKVVEVLLDAELWVDKACEGVGRDFTQTEWDLYVPGDRPFRPVCGEGT